MDKTRQNVWIFEAVLFFEAMYNTKINNQFTYLLPVGCLDASVGKGHETHAWMLVEEKGMRPMCPLSLVLFPPLASKPQKISKLIVYFHIASKKRTFWKIHAFCFVLSNYKAFFCRQLPITTGSCLQTPITTARCLQTPIITGRCMQTPLTTGRCLQTDLGSNIWTLFLYFSWCSKLFLHHSRQQVYLKEIQINFTMGKQ